MRSLRLYSRDLNPSHVGTTYELLDCPLQSGFAVDGCKGCPDGSFCVNVPYSYVGEYLFFGNELYEYCNQDGKILQSND